jgi:hypothetical protein
MQASETARLVPVKKTNILSLSQALEENEAAALLKGFIGQMMVNGQFKRANEILDWFNLT